MQNKYDNITYTQTQKSVLEASELTQEEIIELENIKNNLKGRIFFSAIEAIYIFYKNDYSTLELSQIYDVSVRQIQRIISEMKIKKDRNKTDSSLGVNEEKNELKSKVSSTTQVFRADEDIPPRLNEFLSYLNVIRGKSLNTIAGYKVDLTMFFRFIKSYKGMIYDATVFENININDINDNFIKNIKLPDIYAFLSYVENQRNNSSYARARKVAAIRAFFKYLNTKTKVLDENPAADLETPKISKRNPVYLTLEESKGLINSIDDCDKHPKRDFCIITLFLNCGLRLSELCSINMSSIKEDTLTVIGKGNKERTIYLNKSCLKAISEYLTERSSMEIKYDHRDALFISERKGRINKRTVELIVKKYIGAAGLDKSKYTPHKLRHTAATLMYKHGNVDIRSLQKILGHENIATTQIYTHVDDEKLREAVNANPLNDL